ncbi:hypothetical protein [Spirosoma lituiforme]
MKAKITPFNPGLQQLVEERTGGRTKGCPIGQLATGIKTGLAQQFRSEQRIGYNATHLAVETGL